MTVTARQSIFGIGTTGGWTLVLPSPALAGSLLVCLGTRRSASPGTMKPAGWTDGPLTAANVNQDGVSSAYRIAVGGEQSITGAWAQGGGANDWRVSVVELTGSWVGDPVGTRQTTATTASGVSMPIGPLALPAGSSGVILEAAASPGDAGDGAGQAWTNLGAYVALHNGGDSPHPNTLLAYRIAPSLPASESTNPGYNRNGGMAGLLFAAVESGSSRFHGEPGGGVW